jgi:glycerophosphoryl diester phosphodiesterase/predicted MFS family arabinose efflux permease
MQKLGSTSSQAQATVPSKFSPNAGRMKWLALIVLTAINLLNYIDRYIFSALAPAMQKDLGLNDTQLGVLGSAFILAYVVIAPLFGLWGDRGSRPRIMAIGVGLWSIATAFSGIARTFAGQMATRIAVGLGESAYTVIAPSLIADYFPKTARGRIFAIYSGAIPVGSALGYLLGGLLEQALGWERAFFVVGVPGLLCATVLFFSRDPARASHVGKSKPKSVSGAVTGSESESLAGAVVDGQPPAAVHADSNEVALAVAGGLPQETTPMACTNPWAYFADMCRTLCRNGGFVFVVLGYAAYTFVVGGMAFWMPSYIVRYYDVTLAQGNMVFGGVTVAGGFLGTLLGGWWADRIERRRGNGYLKVSIFSMLLATPLFMLTLSMKGFGAFSAVLFLMEVALFLCISPLDAAVINYVRPEMRSTAMALNVFLIHALGDGISRALIGSISDASGLKAAIAYCPIVLIFAGVIWFIGLVLFWQPLEWPQGALRLPRFQAHRGLWKTTGLQENTLAAFRAARAHGAEMCELDVQLSQDGQVIVFHDKDLRRLAGQPNLVRETTAAELKRLADVPTLEEVLRDPQVTPLFNIELKTNEFWNGALEREVAAVIERTGTQGRVMFSSFNPFSLRRLAKLQPEIPRGLLVAEETEAKNKFWLRKIWLGYFARPHLMHLYHPMITEKRLRSWGGRGLSLAAWTVNDPARAQELLDLKTLSVISDEIMAAETVPPVVQRLS